MPRPGVGAVLLVVAAVFLPVLGVEFVAIDDQGHIASNVHYQSASPWTFLAFWSKPYFGLYVPVTYTVWSFAALLSQALTSTLHPAVFHGLSLVVHLANVALVYRLLRRIIPAPAQVAPALLGAALFGLYPTQVESVAWASELRGLLAMTFGLGALLVLLRDNERPERRPWHDALWATALFLCAVLSKPSAVALPLVAVVLRCFALGQPWRRALPLPAAWLALGAVLAVLTKSLQPDVNVEYVVPLLARPLVALDALGFYASKPVWPWPLSMDYGRAPASVLAGEAGVLVSALGLIALGACVALGRERPWVLCAFGLFVAPLLPVLGLLPFEFQDISTVADRYLYAANLGVAYAAAHGYGKLASSPPRVRLGAALVLVAACALLSNVQARAWHDSETLFTHTLQVNPRSFGAHHGLASHYFAQGRYSLAYDHCKASLAAKPTYLPAEKGLADALLALGEGDAAVRQYQSALERHADARGKQRDLLAEVHADLAVALHRRGDADGAVDQLRSAVALRPDLDVAQRNLGRLLLQRGERSEALAHFRAALEANPFDEASRRALASDP